MIVTGIRGRRRKQLMDDLKEKGGYCILKEEAAEDSLWNRLWTCHKTDCGMNEWMDECRAPVCYPKNIKIKIQVQIYNCACCSMLL